ncbi:GTP cyclohydrolase I FolE2 [Patescibacteria group bacterium]|nr:GTP cyclohydrolase I FolE2 [Patescibacteria group bacterium]
MQDIQNEKDNRDIHIDEVGLRDIVLPLYISDKAKKRQLVVATITMNVSLSKEHKGIHASRFIEVI